MCKKSTTQDFITKAIEIHKTAYDYSKVNYINSKTEVEIICNIHGSFFQKPEKHILRGQGCVKCAVKINGDKKRKSVDKFIEDANKKHKNLYIYDKVKYKSAHLQVEIECKKHGIFKQKPKVHLRGSGCPKCSIISSTNKNTKRIDVFIKQANKKHKNLYIYDKVIYKNAHTLVEIECMKHGIFKQKPHNHLLGNGCPKCNKSKGEITVENFLTSKDIKFECQKRFQECRFKFCLPFDFYIESHNLLIEYQGIQHYKPIKRFGGKKTFVKRQRNDEIKRNFAKSFGYNLLEIRFDENAVDVLNDYFKQLEL